MTFKKNLKSDELMIQLAFKAPNVDNRFFRSEPLSTKQKLKKIVYSSDSIKRKNVSIYEDRDYGLIFEFATNFLKNFTAYSNKNLKSKNSKKFFSNKTLLDLTSKLQSELNSLIVSEHFLSDRPNVDVWSTDFIADDVDDNEGDTKFSNLKEKMKSDFIVRNELLILNMVDKMVKLDVDEFVSLNGMEILLFLFEKHKYEENFLNVIGNCLCLISLGIHFICVNFAHRYEI